MSTTRKRPSAMRPKAITLPHRQDLPCRLWILELSCATFPGLNLKLHKSRKESLKHGKSASVSDVVSSCKSCKGNVANNGAEDCLFLGYRVLSWSGDEFCSTLESPLAPSEPLKFRESFFRGVKHKTLARYAPIVSKLLLTRIQHALQHIDEPWLIVSCVGETRITCDRCLRVPGLAGYKCSKCGEDLCANCQQEMGSKCFRGSDHCLRFVSCLPKEELLDMRQFAEDWASKPFKSTYQSDLEVTEAKPIRRLPATVKGDKIRQVMETGEPMIVSQGSSAAFSLNRFCDLYGHHKCRIEQCANPTKSIRTGTLKSFFNKEWKQRGFKVKDWPPELHIKDACPELVDHFFASLPGKHFIREDGVLNILSMHPTNASTAPDPGPKIYLASGSDEGTTFLHQDLSAAANIILHSEVEVKVSEGGFFEELQGAVWDIFRPQDRTKVVAYLRDRGHLKAEHPIHSQQYYLDTSDLADLSKFYGVHAISFVQKPGDCVFIPVGAPHQVRNLTACIKLAVDFLPPETLPVCLEVADELRQWRIDANADNLDVLELERQIVFSTAFYQQGLVNYVANLPGTREQFRYPWCIPHASQAVQEGFTSAGKRQGKWKVWEALRDHTKNVHNYRFERLEDLEDAAKAQGVALVRR